jgi:hypothetical protein
MLRGMLHGKIAAAAYIKDKLGRARRKARIRAHNMEYAAVLFPHIQQGHAVNRAAIRILSAALRVKDGPVQHDGASPPVRPGLRAFPAGDNLRYFSL